MHLPDSVGNFLNAIDPFVDFVMIVLLTLNLFDFKIQLDSDQDDDGLDGEDSVLD